VIGERDDDADQPSVRVVEEFVKAGRLLLSRRREMDRQSLGSRPACKRTPE
jgi:hypothetical protein